MALTEQTIPAGRIEVTATGDIHVREETIVLRDGERDEVIPARYHRYVLHPGDPLTGRDPRIAAIANAVWTPEIVEAHQIRVVRANAEADRVDLPKSGTAKALRSAYDAALAERRSAEVPPAKKRG